MKNLSRKHYRVLARILAEAKQDAILNKISAKQALEHLQRDLERELKANPRFDVDRFEDAANHVNQ